MPSVQFFGQEQVMDAADNLNCPAWGLFIGRSLFTKYEGDNMGESLAMLQKNLEALGKSYSASVYTLKFFEANGKDIKITERSVCDGGSFNFKMIEPEERAERIITGSSSYGVIAELKKRVETLEKQAEERELDNEQPSGIGAVLIDLIKSPEQMGQLVNIGRSLMGLPVQPMSASMGGTGFPQLPDDVSKESDLERLGIAIDTLEKADPLLVPHLEKLAQMAKDNPTQFKATVSMLDLKL